MALTPAEKAALDTEKERQNAVSCLFMERNIRYKPTASNSRILQDYLIRNDMEWTVQSLEEAMGACGGHLVCRTPAEVHDESERRAKLRQAAWTQAELSGMSPERVKELNAQRTAENAKDKAEDYAAKTAADRAAAKYTFLSKHTGTAAANARLSHFRTEKYASKQAQQIPVKVHSMNPPSDGNVLFYDCTASWNMLEDWLKSKYLPFTAENLERAFEACKPQLAKVQPQPYQRQTDLSASRIVPQRPPVRTSDGDDVVSLQEPSPYLGLTAKDVKKMDPVELRKLTRDPRKNAEINRILREGK